MSALSSFAVLAWDERAGEWQVVKRGLSTYAAANRWAVQFQTRSMRACVRREPVVFPAAPQVAA